MNPARGFPYLWLRRATQVLTLLAFSWTSKPLEAQTVQHGLRVPAGFEVTEFADSRLANDIFCMTLDPKGRVIVAGCGYIRSLVDDKGDGRADRAIEVADAPKDGAQGLWWEGDALYFMGDGGLRRYHIGADGRAIGPSELIWAMKTGGEHDSHAIHRGPDSWLYVLCGNTARIDRRFAGSPASPIQDPVAGCVLRFSPDLKTSEIVADGFRNAYGMDFNADGELFTFESDNERCVSLPWYESTRFYHVVPGGHYGWLAPQHASFWRLPPYFLDVIPPVAYLGRGSPTGVVCYRHTQFPSHYRGGMFLLDWTFGRIYFVSPRRSGSTYTCAKELFLESVGDNGFAPTAAVLHPVTGDLYVSIGGRGTRGAVYRIRHLTGFNGLKATATEKYGIEPRSLALSPGLQAHLLERAGGADALERRRALELIWRHRSTFQQDQLGAVVLANLDHSDRFVRQAAANLLRDLGASQAWEPKTASQELALGFAQHNSPEAAGRLLADPKLDVETRINCVRWLQLILGGLISPKARGTVWEGYTVRSTLHGFPNLKANQATAFRDHALPALRQAFPSGNRDLDREISRTLAAIEDDDPHVLESVAAKLSSDSDPVEDIHYLIVLARLRAQRSPALTGRVAGALLALDKKLDEHHQNRDRNWPLRIAELHAELAARDSGLNALMLHAPNFGRPDHVVFAQCPGFHRSEAAEIFLTRASKDDEFAWSPALVQLIDALPEEKSFPVLRGLWDRGGLEEPILAALARHPRAVDRAKFLQGLNSPQLATIGRCLAALQELPVTADGLQVLALVRCLRRLGDSAEEKRFRQQLGQYLETVADQNGLGSDKDKWTSWFSLKYPAFAERLGGSDGVDLRAWNKRLAHVDWSTGVEERGRPVFTRASCAGCHSGSQAFGPDLHGVTGRFSREDLLTAILQPSKDISPRYRTTLVATSDGKVYQGMIVYDAADSLILQTGPATTVRVDAGQISARRTTDTSLMPAGLLDKLSDQEIADLYAYLKALGKK